MTCDGDSDSHLLTGITVCVGRWRRRNTHVRAGHAYGQKTRVVLQGTVRRDVEASGYIARRAGFVLVTTAELADWSTRRAGLISNA